MVRLPLVGMSARLYKRISKKNKARIEQNSISKSNSLFKRKCIGGLIVSKPNATWTFHNYLWGLSMPQGYLDCYNTFPYFMLFILSIIKSKNHYTLFLSSKHNTFPLFQHPIFQLLCLFLICTDIR